MKKSTPELLREYADIVSEAPEGAVYSDERFEKKLRNAFYITEDETTLHRIWLQGWLDYEAAKLTIQAAKILQQARKLAESK